MVHTISVLYCAHLCMKCSLGISNFLEEISSLSHSVVFLYFFALIVQETGIKAISMEKKCKKAKWLSEEALQIAVKRREMKSKGERTDISI